MKQQLIILLFLLWFCNCFSQEANYKVYSYTEFFDRIEQETDTVFKLKDAIIKYNSKTDARYVIKGKNVYEARDKSYEYGNDIVINKTIELDNVQFLTTDFRNDNGRFSGGVLLDIRFKKSVLLNNTSTLTMRYCRFDKLFQIDSRDCNVNKYVSDVFDAGIDISYSNFKDFNHQIYCSNETSKVSVLYRDNKFKALESNDRFRLTNNGISSIYFAENHVIYEDIFFGLFKTEFSNVTNNIFESGYIQKNINSLNSFQWFDNTYSSTVFLVPSPFSSKDIIGLEQFKNGISAYNGLMDYSLNTTDRYPIHLTDNRSELIAKYMDSVRVYNEKAFREEMSLKSQFYNHFRGRYNKQIANKIYIELKDLETQRLKVVYDLNPGFRSYFKWKVNQFLKLFSDYGTEPSKAIVVSVYVIFFFAFIYLFFPNTWDHRGKNRIMDRYRFFLKYMNKNAGIHEVYLDEKKVELLEAENFKTYLLEQGKTAPKFFTTTALPLYRWSIAGTKTFSWLLSKVDILKGTWSETGVSKQKWKSVLIFFAFFIAIVYDIFIKVLNALMLSINTFTTLGFGEIPIIGLPRYLAIIQGFIGWFMLTIFSVSLISQLLN
ncbi:hypothetical protein SAMN04515667_1706 [Formosa sp. Hel1_31_208]|uniref:potassium channel family protein n=1 Tax=Formosa sp. Hel1_31_208 TaxID=1798225 RepID=UPI00087A2392|nr:potassium channel family protein [Formosa sp. Hel1_31_208]SDS23136.1 hypothetical protein SAMN04515667_1706 [Formosa sp. Hel1_31_208]